MALVHFCTKHKEPSEVNLDELKKLLDGQKYTGVVLDFQPRDAGLPTAIIRWNEGKGPELFGWEEDTCRWLYMTSVIPPLHHCPACGVRLTKDAFTEI